MSIETFLWLNVCYGLIMYIIVFSLNYFSCNDILPNSFNKLEDKMIWLVLLCIPVVGWIISILIIIILIVMIFDKMNDIKIFK